MLDSDDTRWVRFWRTWRGTSKKSETYQRLSDIGSDEKEELRECAEEWGTRQGPASSEFSYGFEIVDKPPKKWITDRIERLQDEISAKSVEIVAMRDMLETLE